MHIKCNIDIRQVQNIYLIWGHLHRKQKPKIFLRSSHRWVSWAVDPHGKGKGVSIIYLFINCLYVTKNGDFLNLQGNPPPRTQFEVASYSDSTENLSICSWFIYKSLWARNIQFSRKSFNSNLNAKCESSIYLITRFGSEIFKHNLGNAILNLGIQFIAILLKDLYQKS